LKKSEGVAEGHDVGFFNGVSRGTLPPSPMEELVEILKNPEEWPKATT